MTLVKSEDWYYVDTEGMAVIPFTFRPKNVAQLMGPFSTLGKANEALRCYQMMQRVTVVEKPYWHNHYGGVYAQVYIVGMEKGMAEDPLVFALMHDPGRPQIQFVEELPSPEGGNGNKTGQDNDDQCNHRQ